MTLSIEECGDTQEAEAKLASVIEALTPSADTKQAYMGEFSFTIPDFDDTGNTYSRVISVPWTTIKEIMAAIKKRADAAPETQTCSNEAKLLEALKTYGSHNHNCTAYGYAPCDNKPCSCGYAAALAIPTDE